MIIGATEPLDWYDAENCSIQLQVDGGAWSDVATVITDINDEENWTIDDSGNDRLLGTYNFVVPNTPGAVCYLKYIDNSDSSELLSDAFEIQELVAVSSIEQHNSIAICISI